VLVVCSVIGSFGFTLTLFINHLMVDPAALMMHHRSSSLLPHLAIAILTLITFQSSSHLFASGATNTNWTTPLINTGPSSTIRIMSGTGNGFAVCYIASNSSLICTSTWGASGPSKITAQDTAYASISGVNLILCALRPTGDMVCMNAAGAYPSPYVVFSSLAYGTSGGCGIQSATALAYCWLGPTPSLFRYNIHFLQVECMLCYNYRGTETETFADGSSGPAVVAPSTTRWRYLGWGIGSVCGVTLDTNQVQCFGSAETLMVIE
jgi:hypothetical protein